MNIRMITAPLVVALLTTGCVSQGTYDEAVSKTVLTQAKLDKTTSSLAESNAQTETARIEIARLDELMADLSKSSKLDSASKEARLAELRTRLSELRLAQQSAEARTAVFRDVALRLKKQVDAGDLTIVIRDGRMVLQLPNDVLFDSGKTELKPAGESALAAVAGVLAAMPSRHFQVAGHTDNVPIHNERFASNWELSSGRALRVVHFLIDKGASADMLSAAGYGEMDPLTKNIDAASRRGNRRTEITLQPNIDELVKMP